MLRATPIFVLASVVLAAGCSDQPAPTVPTRPNLTLSTYPTPTTYTVTVGAPVTLQGLPGSDYNIAYEVNSLGDVVGLSNLGGGSTHAVRWPGGSTVPIDMENGTPYDINTAGQLAGQLYGHAALWTPDGAGGYTQTNVAEQLPSAIVSSASSINASGQIVGTYSVLAADGVEVEKCFLWTPEKPNATTGTITTLPDFGGGHCWPSDVNSAGSVVGAATTTRGETHGFVWLPSYAGRLSKIRDLTPNGGWSSARAINDAGQVAGQHTTEAGLYLAAIWTPSGLGSYVMMDLGTFTGNQSWAMDINDAGFVVGFARHPDPSGGADDAFIWQNGEFTLLPGLTTINEPMGLTGLNGSSIQVVGGSYDVVTNARTAVRWPVTIAAPGSSSK